MRKPIVEFANWFRAQASRLRTLELREAVNEISRHLEVIDSGLGLVMSDIGQVREFVLTAEGDPGRFDLVRNIRDALGDLPSWVFTALKPPRGFDFVVRTKEGGHIQASELFFDPLTTDETPPRLGVRIFLPREVVTHSDIQWMLRLCTETGIGEELSAQIAFFEAAPMADTPNEALPIEALADFVGHFVKVSRN